MKRNIPDNFIADRASQAEQMRIANLLSLMPATFSSGLDIGARDGYVSVRMAEECCEHVTALDLSMPEILHDRIACIQGDITDLKFSDSSFDLVLCAEVLEHISPDLLSKACQELARVTKKWLVIGVPFNQDIRVASTRCPSCGKTNPPWGHLSTFTQDKLCSLFPHMNVEKVNFIGESKSRTNSLSYLLMDFAGHPFGTYNQGELCVYCNSEIERFDQRTFIQKLATRIGFLCDSIQNRFSKPQPIWIHILFKK